MLPVMKIFATWFLQPAQNLYVSFKSAILSSVLRLTDLLQFAVS